MPRGPGIIQRKILLLLLGGLALGLSGSPRRYFKILKLMGREWGDLNRQALWRSIKALYKSRLVDAQEGSDGLTTLALSEKGKKFALVYKIDEMKVMPENPWDKKWRIIAFDVPEKRRKIREALHQRLLQIGFKEFQKSVFICPYPCDKEMDFLIEFYQARSYVRKIIAESIDNDLHFRQKFGLL